MGQLVMYGWCYFRAVVVDLTVFELEDWTNVFDKTSLKIQLKIVRKISSDASGILNIKSSKINAKYKMAN